MTENEYNINRFSKLLNKLEINYSIKMQGKNYSIELKRMDLRIDDIDIEKSQDMMKAIVRGVFLGSGWVTEPASRYHLELNLKKEADRDKLISIINKFGIEVKKLERKSSYSIYIKDRRGDI